ncbi:MAG TPA: YihY/virulence factor BrkB family protein [Candidatus Dormibacteraeota bacterium]|nr:YihY/virulence factor BrkB family protein [Candidatus Dormibacteraeota bacterium]
MFPRCGMVSQAAAFNMFLVFFPLMLILLGFFNSWMRTRAAMQDIIGDFYEILPPGGRQVMENFLLPRVSHPWEWVAVGWAAILLGGSQVMKLLMEGVQIIYGDTNKHSFLGRQFRGLLLLLLTIAPWLVGVMLSVSGTSARDWAIHETERHAIERGMERLIWAVTLPFTAMILATLVLAVIYRVARPSKQSWKEVLPGAVVATVLWWLVNFLFGMYVKKMPYTIVYGGMAAIIGLLVWMELSAMIVFLGAAWNAEGAAKDES